MAKGAPTPKPQPTKPSGASPPSSSQSSTSSRSIGVVRGTIAQGEKIGIYGPGGIGKTELVASLPQVGLDPLFLDLDQGTMGIDVARATLDDGSLAYSFEDVRAALQGIALSGDFDAIVIDTFSSLEDRIREWVIDNVPHEKGRMVRRIEDYGFGKGFSHIFEAAMLILQDLDAIARRGIHCIVVCHQCTEKVPSAEVDDYYEYQPRLQSPPKTGKLRERVFEWCNHFFRIDHDRSVNDDGRVAKGDVRSIHTVRTTTAWAKHRTIPNGREFPEVIPYPKGSHELWDVIFGEE
ncbi:hypothetical protein Pan216_21230 [Planctomycetes bacterium Pan216]|uniref:Uncharacterized protein n=1 Tax=Kolteria novifilia TaxID=2527975 RepID=A0A518B2Q3_9BACT|nr:hypothetical protein Pan216_21230 [Planctomycetes bacterium Pan216]